MKNLNLWNASVRDFKFNEKFSLCYGPCESNSEVYLFSNNLNLSKLHENGEVQWNKDLKDTISKENLIVNLTYLLIPNLLCVGLSNGELFTISDCGNRCQLAGYCDSGLLALEWSGDQELLVLVTKDMKAILMTCTFDPINEVSLLDQEFGEKQFITVGWGKKETQFHGSDGKQAAKSNSEVFADPCVKTDNTVKISWRGDGIFYCIGFTMNGIRRFKVFDREGNLQYTNEKQQGLEANLSWRPSGNVIATTQKLPDKYVVAFFEKNGLKHGEFEIPVNLKTIVENILWSSDSEVLALQCKDMELESQKILLFTSSNYHWYLKQVLSFKNDQKIANIVWDNNFEISNNKKMHILFENGQHYTYSWIWNIDSSRGTDVYDDAVVAVIDGNKLLMTGFRQTVVPPPMAALVLELDSFVNSVHFAPSCEKYNTNCFFVCTTSNKLLFYEQIQKFPLQYKVTRLVDLHNCEFPFQNFNWHWLNEDTLVCVSVDGENTFYLKEYNLNSETIVETNAICLPSAVTRIQCHPNSSSKLFLQLDNGDIMQYTNGSLEPHEVSFGVPCLKFNVLSIDSDMYFLGLSHKGNLYLNDSVMMNNVSSFLVHTHFLLITTLQHVLLCTKLTKQGLDNIIDLKKNESPNVYKRKIERGAKLIIAVPNDTRTVFQMPRGNLEAIQPRPLSLKTIGEYLDSFKYLQAFDLMRKQRINLNLIYDHDPEKFLEHIDVFLEAIKNNSWLSLFLSDLENIDVTKSMYSSSYMHRKNEKQIIGLKIHKICDAVREGLLSMSDKDSRILPLLTSFVKKNTNEDLEHALNMIKHLKLQESGGSKIPVGSDEALKFLLYMVDVNHLFDVALGMYDFDLVLLIANKSQKDPKEYIPMLNELNEMDENYKKFSINKHLKRFDRAVQYLAKCGKDKHNELKTFVKYHSLYREALKLFCEGEEIYKEISDDFGLHLSLKKQYTEAGIIYERAGNYDKAVDCYKEALEWELAIKLAKESTKQKLCWDLVTALKEEKRHMEALIILEQFYEDDEATIKYAINCGQYKTAIRLCSQYNRSDIRDNFLKPALLEEYNNVTEIIKNNQSDFIKYRDRLQVVRENKSKCTMTYDSYNNKDSDLYSDAGSTIVSSASRTSGKTFRSSKNRRKHERKMASLKEGSQYEDVALIMALYTLVVSSFGLRLQVKDINTALSWFCKDEEAYVLQSTLERFLKAMKDDFKIIWTNDLVIEATTAAMSAQEGTEGLNIIPQGIATLEPHLRIAPIIQDINWKLEGLD